MILLDTNVVSETMKPAPSQMVQRWLDEQAAETLYLSSVTIAEAMFGIRTMPDGKRKQGLAEALDVWIGLFEGRILPFDLPNPPLGSLGKCVQSECRRHGSPHVEIQSRNNSTRMDTSSSVLNVSRC